MNIKYQQIENLHRNTYNNNDISYKQNQKGSLSVAKLRLEPDSIGDYNLTNVKENKNKQDRHSDKEISSPS